jgi:MSHA biogenesis protein MshL
MNMFVTATMFLLTMPQDMPGELAVSQLENARGTTIVVVGGQVPTITNISQLPATQIEQQQTPLRGRRFSVDFRGVELRAALTALGQEAGVNLVMPPDITGELTIDLVSVNLAQALDAILTPRGLQFRIEENLLRVDPVQMETRTFSFDYITTQRSLIRPVSPGSPGAAVSVAPAGAMDLHAGPVAAGGVGGIAGSGERPSLR